MYAEKQIVLYYYEVLNIIFLYSWNILQSNEQTTSIFIRYSNLHDVTCSDRNSKTTIIGRTHLPNKLSGDQTVAGELSAVD